MRKILMRALCTALALSLWVLPGVRAETPVFSFLDDAVEYVEERQLQRAREASFEVSADAAARWETNQLRELFIDSLNYCSAYSLTLDRRDDRSAAVRVSFTYRDSVRMVDAWRSGDTSALSSEEARCLQRAKEIVAGIKAAHGGALQRELAVYDYICEHMRYQNYDYGTDAFRRIVTACSGLLDGEGNCQSYANAFYLLGSLAGLDVGFLSGWNGDHQSEHVWNTITIDGEALLVDVTAGDWNQADVCPTHLFFNVRPDMIPEGSLDWYGPLTDVSMIQPTPQSTSYFNNQAGFGICVDSAQQLASYAVSQAQSGQRFVEVLVLNQVLTQSDIDRALHDVAGRLPHRTQWTCWMQENRGHTHVLLRWDLF